MERHRFIKFHNARQNDVHFRVLYKFQVLVVSPEPWLYQTHPEEYAEMATFRITAITKWWVKPLISCAGCFAHIGLMKPHHIKPLSEFIGNHGIRIITR